MLYGYVQFLTLNVKLTNNSVQNFYSFFFRNAKLDINLNIVNLAWILR